MPINTLILNSRTQPTQAHGIHDENRSLLAWVGRQSAPKRHRTLHLLAGLRTALLMFSHVPVLYELFNVEAAKTPALWVLE